MDLSQGIDLAQTGVALWLAFRLERLLGQLTTRVERIEQRIGPEPLPDKALGFRGEK